MWQDPAQRWLDDFAVGDVVESRGRTVDAGDFTAFAGLTGDHYPLHTSDEYCAGTRFGHRVAHGALTFSLALGLIGMTGFYGDAIVALVGIEGFRARRPVFAGDTVRARGTVLAVEPGESARPGLITVGYTVFNQHGDEVMCFEPTMLAKRRGAETGRLS